MPTTAEGEAQAARIHLIQQKIGEVQSYIRGQGDGYPGGWSTGRGRAAASWLVYEGGWYPPDYQVRFFVLAAGLIAETLQKEPAIYRLGVPDVAPSARWRFLRTIEKNKDIATWANYTPAMLAALVQTISKDPDPLVRIQAVKAIQVVPLPAAWITPLYAAWQESAAGLPTWAPYGTDTSKNAMSLQAVDKANVALATDLDERKAQLASAGMSLEQAAAAGVITSATSGGVGWYIAAGIGVVFGAVAAVIRTPRGARAG